jgi:hypothetical protein
MSLTDVGYVGYGIESTEGIMVAPTIFLPASSFSIDTTDENVVPSQIRGTRDNFVALPGPYSVSGTMEMELTPNGIRNLLKSALAHSGAITPSAYTGGGYQMVYVPGSALTPTFSFETSAADILFMRYGGIRVNTLEINAAFGEIVTSSWGLEGTTRAKQGSGSTESYPTGTGANPFHFTGVSVKLGGSSIGTMKSFQFTVGNNIEREGTLNNTRAWNRTVLGKRDLGLSGTFDFQDTAEYDRFFAGADFAVELLLQGASITGGAALHTLKIALPRVRWNSVNAPLQAGSVIEQAVTATVLRPLAGTDAVTVTLVTDESTAF